MTINSLDTTGANRFSAHTLKNLAKAHATVNGRFGFDPTNPEHAAAWRAIMLSYPELLEAARLSRTLCDIAQERQRQQREKGWTAEHDDGHSQGELALAAAAYAYNAGQGEVGRAWNVGRHPVVWPWSAESWKPKDRRRDLVRAAALIVAEIERLDRAATMTAV